MINPYRGFGYFFLGDSPEILAKQRKSSRQNHQACINVHYIFQDRRGIEENNKCNDQCCQDIDYNLFKPLHFIGKNKMKKGTFRGAF